MAEETKPGTVLAEAAAEETDPLRTPMLEVLQAELGDDLVGFELTPGDDLTVRVNRPAWRRTVRLCRDRLGMRYFCFLAGMDWKLNPDLKGEKTWDPEFTDDAGAETEPAEVAPEASESERQTGVAGGDTRFQVFVRVYDVGRHVGITLKADLDEDDPRIDSLVELYRGADWHEREAWEMYGFVFDGHPGLRHLYLPGAFEGYPLRKDFPLLARLVKPWPGLVNVEAIPGGEADDADGVEA
ncbi:MAG: NADH-quinone oxidoreductase subunit C [Actinomycetota bacterium]|nr:NADH-quinone oxidoreductase subunit C [Actinomycetota bacterium]